MSKNQIKDLTGRRFGRLRVIEQTAERKDRCVVWKCVCDCGNECYIVSRSLLSGTTKSCGCFMQESRGKARTTHHRSKEKIFFIWQGMHRRCESTYHKNYMDYGGRGIKVCEEWRSFQKFYDYVATLSHFGEPGYTIDRIDVNGNYEPGNVRWATRKEQGANRRCTVYLTYKGETRPLTEWAEIKNIKPDVLYQRSHKGWSVEKMLETPVGRWAV